MNCLLFSSLNLLSLFLRSADRLYDKYMSKIHSRNILTNQYNDIIPTGWLSAYSRTFTDIPYSQAVFNELETIKTVDGSDEQLDAMKDNRLAPQFEARHKLLNRLIAQTGIKQIIEVEG